MKMKREAERFSGDTTDAKKMHDEREKLWRERMLKTGKVDKKGNRL